MSQFTFLEAVKIAKETGRKLRMVGWDEDMWCVVRMNPRDQREWVVFEDTGESIASFVDDLLDPWELSPQEVPITLEQFWEAAEVFVDENPEGKSVSYEDVMKHLVTMTKKLGLVYED